MAGFVPGTLNSAAPLDLKFAVDPNRMARFSREAQVLAALSHSNAGAIYGLEESGGKAAPMSTRRCTSRAKLLRRPGRRTRKISIKTRDQYEDQAAPSQNCWACAGKLTGLCINFKTQREINVVISGALSRSVDLSGSLARLASGLHGDSADCRVHLVQQRQRPVTKPVGATIPREALTATHFPIREHAHDYVSAKPGRLSRTGWALDPIAVKECL